ncbi:MAG: Methyltransferase type 12 [Ferruginibacter sp.]|nr:Methyltransferase type 12 [Ferruginibacter sp.]
MQDDLYQYPGKELELFSTAKNWKQYIARLISPYIHGNVLEVGAGIGANTLVLFNNSVTSWLLLEPDKKFYDELSTLLDSKKIPAGCSAINGYLGDLPPSAKFDTILYIDVLEHIKCDKCEIAAATNLLSTGGKLIVLAPAHEHLMSPFDIAIGHYRRYSKNMLAGLVEDERLQLLASIYVDSIGLFASMANKYFLKQSYPGKKQIAFWNNWMIPLSRIIDPILSYKCGKTIIAVWQKK